MHQPYQITQISTPNPFTTRPPTPLSILPLPITLVCMAAAPRPPCRTQIDHATHLYHQLLAWTGSRHELMKLGTVLQTAPNLLTYKFMRKAEWEE